MLAGDEGVGRSPRAASWPRRHANNSRNLDLLPRVAHAEPGQSGLAQILVWQDTTCELFMKCRLQTGIATGMLTFTVGSASRYHGIQGT